MHVPMTEQGFTKLKQELHELKTIQRPNVISAIAEARSHGDLSENAEYEAAKNRQSLIEGRIKDLEGKLASAKVINPKLLANEGRVIFGASVDLINNDSGEQMSYQIVGDDEADLKHGLISVSSPIARALIGKYEGDEVEVQAPSGTISYTIGTIRFE